MQECSAPKGIVFSPFWSENEYRLCPFLSEIGYGFRENYGNVWMYLSFQFQSNKKEREVCKFEMNFKKSFCWRSNLSKWWHNFLEASSENGCKKWPCLVCNRVRTYRIGRHNPTKNSQEYLPLSPPLPRNKVMFFEVAVLPLFWAVHRNDEHYFRGQFRNKKRQKST